MSDKYDKITVKTFATIEELVRFFIEEKGSDTMKIDIGSMKVLFDIYTGKVTDNFYIGNQGMYARDSEIRVKLLEDDNTLDFQTVVLEEYPIICHRSNGVDYIHYAIESTHQIRKDYLDKDYDNYDAQYKHSKAAMNIKRMLRESEERIDTYKL